MYSTDAERCCYYFVILRKTTSTYDPHIKDYPLEILLGRLNGSSKSSYCVNAVINQTLKQNIIFNVLHIIL